MKADQPQIAPVQGTDTRWPPGSLLSSIWVIAKICGFDSGGVDLAYRQPRFDHTEVLNQAIEALRTFKPMTEEKIADLLGRTREVAAQGRFELYKISQHFEGTAHNPQWLG